MKNIPEDAPIDYIKKHQPHFVEVDWGNPQIIDGRKYYYIQNIKGSHDALNMSHQLVFENDKYQGYNSNK